MHSNYLPPKVSLIRIDCSKIICESILTDFALSYAGTWEEENVLDLIIE